MRPKFQISLTICLLFLSAHAQEPSAIARLKDAKISGHKGNDPSCPSAVINVLDSKRKRTVLLGQTSFTSSKDQRKSVFKQPKSDQYKCDETITVERQKNALLKTTEIKRCSGKDKELERRLIEKLVIKKGNVLFTRNDSKERGKLSCAYSIH